MSRTQVLYTTRSSSGHDAIVTHDLARFSYQQTAVSGSHARAFLHRVQECAQGARDQGRANGQADFVVRDLADIAAMQVPRDAREQCSDAQDVDYMAQLEEFDSLYTIFLDSKQLIINCGVRKNASAPFKICAYFPSELKVLISSIDYALTDGIVNAHWLDHSGNLGRFNVRAEFKDVSWF